MNLTPQDELLLEAIADAKCPNPKCGCTEFEIVRGEPADPDCGIAETGDRTCCADCGYVIEEHPTRAEVEERAREERAREEREGA